MAAKSSVTPSTGTKRQRRKKAGRPTRHPVDVVRTKLWCHGLTLATGMTTGNALEQHFEPHLVRRRDDGTVLRPRKWDAYLDGTRVPQRMKGKAYAIELVERELPGSARVFESVCWVILKGAQLTPDECRELIQQVSPGARKLLQQLQTLDKRGKDDQRAALRLAAQGGIDALESIVVLLAISETNKLYKVAHFAHYAATAMGLFADPLLHKFRNDLLFLIRDRFHEPLPISVATIATVFAADKG